jgi:hypothetical protein
MTATNTFGVTEQDLIVGLTDDEIGDLASLAKQEGWPFEDYVNDVLRGHLFLSRELADQETSDQEVTF